MITILIADAEERTRSSISDFMEESGYRVLQAKDGREAMNLIDSNIETLDLAILDVAMPFCDGLSVLHYIRKLSPETPALMLTAESGETGEAFGSGLGADGYIGKPLSLDVLSARVDSALKRRSRPKKAGVLRPGGLRIDELKRIVLLNGDVLPLTPKEYELLAYFKNNQNVAMSREKILNAVWGYDYCGSLRTVDTHVKKLRAKLACGRDRIQTVRGYGYRFDAED